MRIHDAPQVGLPAAQRVDCHAILMVLFWIWIWIFNWTFSNHTKKEKEGKSHIPTYWMFCLYAYSFARES